MKLTHSLVGMYWESTRPTRFFAAIASILAALGVYFKSDDLLDDHTLVNSIMPWNYWALILLTVGFIRIYNLLVPERTNNTNYAYFRISLAILSGVIGIIVWSVLLVSSVAVINVGLNLVLCIFCIMEVWLLSRALLALNYPNILWKRKL